VWRLEGGLNTYGYVRGDPVNLIDPSGMVAAAVPAIVACLLDPPCAALAMGAAVTAGQACKVAWGRGSTAKRSKDTGEIWEKDMPYGDHYEVYKNRIDYERGRRDRSAWDDGRPKERYRR
jgi:uncharacterized protein RhaS with RHS repeats